MASVIPTEKLESLILAVTTRVVDWPRSALALILVICGLLSIGMGSLYTDVTNESLFHETDPSLRNYHRFLHEFGRDDLVLAIITSDDTYSVEYLRKLKAYHEDLERNVPYLDEVSSLMNVNWIDDMDGELIIDDLKNIWPKTKAEVAQFRKTVMDSPLYRNIYLSEAGDVTLVMVRASAYATDADMGMAESNAKSEGGKGGFIQGFHDRLHKIISGDTRTPAVNSKSIAATAKAEEKVDSFPAAMFAGYVDGGNNDSLNDIQPALNQQQLRQFVEAIWKVSERHNSEGFRIRFSGGPIIDYAHQVSVHEDFGVFMFLSVLVITAILFYLVRSARIILMILATVILSLLSTLGVMGWMGYPVTPVVTAMPPLLLTIGIMDSLHLVSVFYLNYERIGDCRGAILHSISRTGVAIVFTSLTTMAGFFAFSFAEIKPISDFGRLAAFGILLAMILSLVMIPALLSLNSKTHEKIAEKTSWRQKALPMKWLCRFGLKNANAVLLVFLILGLLSIPGLQQLALSHNVMNWFPKDHQAKLDTKYLDTRIPGSVPLEFIIDTGMRDGIQNPDFMRKLRQFQDYAESLNATGVKVGRATSIVDSISRIHQVLEPGSTDILPNNSNLLAQELLFFESSGTKNVARLVDTNHSKARVTVRTTWADAVDYVPLRSTLYEEARNIFGPNVKIIATGSVDLMSKSLLNVLKSMKSSYIVSALIISLMLIVLLGSVRFGLICMIPNFLPILFALGVMGYTGMPIDMFTVMLGSIALGLVVDDTVHFMHGFKFNRIVLGSSLEESVDATVELCGPALLFTTVSLAGGFAVFLFSSMNTLPSLGIMLVFTVVVALLADLLLGPALLRRFVEPMSILGSSRKAQVSIEN